MKWLVLIAAVLSTLLSVGNAKPPEVVQLRGQNTVIMDREIDGSSADGVTAAVIGKRLMLPPEEVLYIVIVSPGGYNTYAQSIHDIVKAVPNVKFICKYCASAAGWIFATAGNGNRLAIEKSTLVMHEMFLPHVTARDLFNTKQMAQFARYSRLFNQQMSDVLCMPVEMYEARILGTTWELHGADLVKYHLADQLVTIECDGYIKSLAPDTCSALMH